MSSGAAAAAEGCGTPKTDTDEAKKKKELSLNVSGTSVTILAASWFLCCRSFCCYDKKKQCAEIASFYARIEPAIFAIRFLVMFYLVPSHIEQPLICVLCIPFRSQRHLCTKPAQLKDNNRYDYTVHTYSYSFVCKQTPKAC